MNETNTRYLIETYRDDGEPPDLKVGTLDELADEIERGAVPLGTSAVLTGVHVWRLTGAGGVAPALRERVQASEARRQLDAARRREKAGLRSRRELVLLLLHGPGTASAFEASLRGELARLDAAIEALA